MTPADLNKQTDLDSSTAALTTLERIQTELQSAEWSYDEAFCRNRGLISEEEQQRLKTSRVAIAGLGGVGGVHLMTLARLGIGRFTIADPDTFETANINRQYGARTDTRGRSKAEVMAEEARRINPDVELRVFDRAVQPEAVSEFLDGADLFVDGIDFFSIAIRRKLFRQAAANGIYAITAGPMGFGSAWLVFDPAGMSFDEYFDLNDSQSDLEQLIAFAVGVAPGLLHRPYLDLSQVSLTDRNGPSAGMACQLCSGVAAAEAIKILLNRGGVKPVPHFAQFDAYRGHLKQGRLRWGNRGPMQQLKRAWLRRRFATKSTPNTKSTPKQSRGL